MCGLAGIFDTRGRRPIDTAALRRMSEVQAHRGPDGRGEHVGPGIGLAHRRLAIIDLGGGHQPLANEDGSVLVVFNGEIYNYAVLAAELATAGHRFRTHSDTEVIVHAWEEWGMGAVDRFDGMFAFALFDAGRETLVLARDRLGKKPLYYAELADGTLAFASELKGVMAHGRVPSDLDPLAIEDFFAFGYVPDPRSIRRAVRKLPPAHLMTWRRGASPRLTRYWDLPMDGAAVTRPEEAAEDLRARLRAATRARMVADVPLGAFLSGGVDSSVVVATMASLSEQPVRTFAIGFGDSDHDESAYASRLAERYATRHTVRRLAPDALPAIDRLAAAYDEPFGDSSAIPTWAVCALARQQATVALSGDGGDELFGGYRRYRMHLNAERVRAIVPGALRRPLFGTLCRIYPKADWAPRFLRARTTLEELALPADEAYFRTVAVIGDQLRRRLLAPQVTAALQGYRAADTIRAAMAAADTADMLLKMQYADFRTWLPGRILVKVDRASMANSLEVRAPLLDHHLAEWSARLDAGLKLAGGEGKRVLKRAAEPLVDRDLLYRPKRGFSLPLARWLRGPLRPRLEAVADPGGRLAASGLLVMDTVAALVRGHLSGRRDHSAALWLVVMFDAFLALEEGRPAGLCRDGAAVCL